MRKAGLGAACLLALLLLSACDSGKPQPTPPPATATPPTIGIQLTGTPPPQGTRPCLAADLQALAGWQGATGAMAGAIALTNKSSTSCALEGRPGVHLTDSKGSLLPIANLDLQPAETTASVSPVAPRRVILRPGAQTFARFVWRNWCGTQQGPYNVAIALPGEGGQITVPALDPSGAPLSTTPRCDDPKSTSVLSIGEFETR